LINCSSKFFISAFLVSIASVVFAQDEYVQQGSYWIRYYNQSQISDRTVIHFQLDERRLVNPDRQFQLFTHLNVNYKVKPWLEVGAGLNFNWTDVNKNVRVPEWRPWQEANIILPMSGKWQFQFRYRLDDRFIHNNNKVDLTEGYHFYFRHRFRVQFSRELKISDTKRALMRFSDEIMLNTGDAPFTFDQNRVYAALEYPFSRHWSVETGYLNILQSRTDDTYYIRHTIRVTVYHKLDFRRGKVSK